MATIEQLKTLANQVANATEIGENTAGRVGGALQQAADLIASLLNSASTAETTNNKQNTNISDLQSALVNLQTSLGTETTDRKSADSSLKELIDALQTQLNNLVGGNASTAIDNFNEVIKFLSGVTDDETLTALLTAIQDRITALETLQKSGYRFMGVATPDTDPEKPAFRAAYLAVGKGTYANFHTGIMVASDGGNEEVQIELSEGESAYLMYDGYKGNAIGWHKEPFDLSDVVCGIVKKQLRGVEDGVAPLEHDGLISFDYLPEDEMKDKFVSTIMVSDWGADVKPNVKIQHTEGDYGYNTESKKLYIAKRIRVGDIFMLEWVEAQLKETFIYVNKAENVPYRWTGTDMVAIAPKQTPASIFNATNELPITGYYVLYDANDTSMSAVHAAWNAGKAVSGLIISFERSTGIWKTYQYVGKTVTETNWLNPDNWQDFGSLAAGSEPYVIIDSLVGAPTAGSYYTLESAVQALIAYQDKTGVTYAKKGLIISYNTAANVMETKQFQGEVTDFGEIGLWKDFGGGSEVETKDVPVSGGKDALSTGGAYASIPTDIDVNTETSGVVKLQLKNAGGENIGDEKQFNVGTGSGGGTATIVTVVFNESPMYGKAGGEFILKPEIHSVTTQGQTSTENHIETLQLIDRDTAQTLQTINVNQSSSIFTIDVSSYFTEAGSRHFRLVATDDAGNTGSRNINVVAVDVTITSAQTSLNYTSATALQVGGQSKTLPMYKFANNASDKGILATIEVFLNNTWQVFATATITDTFSHSVTIDPNNVLNSALTHGCLPLRIHGEDIASGVVGNYLYTGLFVIDELNSTPIAVTRWYANSKTATIKLFETISIDFAVYDPNSTSANASVYVDGTLSKSVLAYRSQTYTFTQKVLNAKYDGTVTKTVNVRIGSASSVTASFVVNGTLLAVDDFTAQEQFSIDLTGRSNSESDHTIENKGVRLSVSDVNWRTTGFVNDTFGTNAQNGTVGLRIAEDATGLLDYKPFSDSSVETNGMAMQFRIMRKNIANDDTRLIECINNGYGFYVDGKNVVFTFDNGQTVAHTITAALEAGRAVDVTIVIQPVSVTPTSFGGTIGIAKMYFDGEEIGACYYDAGTLVAHNTPIKFNGTDGDLYIYNWRAWQSYPTFEQAFNMYLLQMTDTDAMIDEYNFNNVMASQTAENTTKNRPQARALYNQGLPYFVLCKNADTADNDAKDNYPEYLEGLDGDKKTKRILDVYFYDPNRPWQDFKAVGVTVTNQGTTSSRRPIKNIKMKFKSATITLLHDASEFTGEALEHYNECLKNAAKKRVQPTDKSLPTNIITVKVDYSESGGANNGASTELYNKLQRALGANYMTPAQNAYTGKYILNTSIDSIPCAYFRTDRFSPDATSPAYGYFHAKGNWNDDKGDAKVFGFEGIDGYNADCLNYGDFTELVADRDMTLDAFDASINKALWATEDVVNSKGEITEHAIHVLTEFCGPNYRVYRYKDGKWVNTTGTMKCTNGKWSVEGDVLNPVSNYELLKYDSFDWFQGCNSLDDILVMATNENNKQAPIWMQYFESRYPDDDNLNALYEAGKKVPYNLYRWLRFCQDCNHHLDASNGNIMLSGKSVAGTPANRLLKWKQELHTVANVYSVLCYDVFTDYLAAVDQRSKNMMVGFYLDTDGSYTKGVCSTVGMRMYLNHLYDGDTINGSDNDCGLTIPALLDPNNDAKGMYQGHDSVLFMQNNAVGNDGFWLNDDGSKTITKRAVAQDMRTKDVGDGLVGFSVAGMEKFWITDRLSKWAKVVSSFDGERKYIEASKPTANYLYALHGLSIQRLRAYIKERFEYRDGFYQTGDLFKSSVAFRATGTDIKIKITAAKQGYFAVGVDRANAATDSCYLQAGESYTLKTGMTNTGSGTMLYVFGANRLASLDISGCTPSAQAVDFSELVLLKHFIIGGAGYTLDNNAQGAITTLTLGNMPFLETLDIRNTAITTISAEYCPRLTTLYAAGSQLQRVNLAVASKITRLELPKTYSWLQLEYLPNLTNDGLTFEGMSNLQRICVLSCSKFDGVKLINKVLASGSKGLKYVRVQPVSMTGDGTDIQSWIDAGLKGIDADLSTIVDYPAIVGKYQLSTYTATDTLNGWQQALPELHIEQQAYTDYKEFDNVQDSKCVTNMDNKTGYDFSNAYVPSGHILRIKEKSIPVKGAYDSNTHKMTLTALDKSDYTKYADGTSFDNTDALGEKYDVFMYIPHFWYKGINDFLKQEKHTLISSNKNKPADTWTIKKGGTLAELLYADMKGVDVTKATVGSVLSDDEFAELTACAVYRVDVEGQKQVRYIGMNTANYGSCFVDGNGKILQSDTLQISGIAASPLDFSNDNGDYIFRNVPDGAKYLYFTCLRSVDQELEAFSVDSSDIEAIETGWVEHKSELIGVYGASIDDLKFIRSVSGKTTVTGNGVSTTSSEWKYDADGTPNSNVINTPNWTYQDLLNACEYRGKGYYGVTYEQNKIIAILSRCYTGNLDDQTVYGYGTGTRYVTGQKDKVGMDTTSTNSGPNKTWGLEGWIACNYEIMDNVGVNITTFKDWKAALRPDNGNTNVTNDTMHVYDPRTDTERVVKWLNSSGYCIARLRHGRYCDIAASSCNTDNSKWNTRYAAIQWYNRTGGRVVGRAYYNAHAYGGCVCARANGASSHSYTDDGVRLSYLGEFTNEGDIDEDAK